ncbi:MAG TPA: HemK/PrmC family methyltransferase [Patescibacteria group bacterium]|nr:HemK/PrmC family methyltransferase [Patescibacteria group bacterium]
METTVGSWLEMATALLTRVGIGTAHLDALVLLEDCLHQDRAKLLAHPETKLSDAHIVHLTERLQRRAGHEPMAYLRGKTEFYGRPFYIDHRVLEPRPESETMIDMLKKLFKRPGYANGWTIIDVGTGSGALAITAKLELPKAEVMATDVDPECIKVAEENCQTYHCDVHFLKGDLLKPLYMHYHPEQSVLLCNLPYVPDHFQINPAAMQEPRIAIFGGPDGLDVYRKLFEQIDPLAYKPQYLLTEAMPPQQELLASIASSHGYRLHKTEDFIQLFIR